MTRPVPESEQAILDVHPSGLAGTVALIDDASRVDSVGLEQLAQIVARSSSNAASSRAVGWGS